MLPPHCSAAAALLCRRRRRRHCHRDLRRACFDPLTFASAVGLSLVHARFFYMPCTPASAAAALARFEPGASAALGSCGPVCADGCGTVLLNASGSVPALVGCPCAEVGAALWLDVGSAAAAAPAADGSGRAAQWAGVGPTATLAMLDYTGVLGSLGDAAPVCAELAASVGGEPLLAGTVLDWDATNWSTFQATVSACTGGPSLAGRYFNLALVDTSVAQPGNGWRGLFYHALWVNMQVSFAVPAEGCHAPTVDPFWTL